MQRVAAILFVGDIVASAGRRALRSCCPACARSTALDFVVVNGENAAGGIGITPKHADELFAAGVDVITLGNHTYRHREVWPYLDEQKRILRPANFLQRQPGHGTCVFERDDGATLGVVNLSGNLFMQAASPAFATVDDALQEVARRRPRAGRHARRGDEREGRDGLVPRRPRDRGGRAPTRTCRPPTRACSRAAPPTSPTSG